MRSDAVFIKERRLLNIARIKRDFRRDQTQARALMFDAFVFLIPCVKRIISCFCLVCAATLSAAGAGLDANSYVFVILMENHNWSTIKNSSSAPYINNTLLPLASYCEQYYNPPNLHPSEPNYLWLEAGTNFGILNDNPPANNHQATTNHFVTQLKDARISWKTYQESITGATCPMTDAPPYYVKHNPFAFFDDVTIGVSQQHNAAVYCNWSATSPSRHATTTSSRRTFATTCTIPARRRAIA